MVVVVVVVVVVVMRNFEIQSVRFNVVGIYTSGTDVQKSTTMLYNY
jgi:hypothetical protein